jgi:hypothetical protein
MGNKPESDRRQVRSEGAHAWNLKGECRFRGMSKRSLQVMQTGQRVQRLLRQAYAQTIRAAGAIKVLEVLTRCLPYRSKGDGYFCQVIDRYWHATADEDGHYCFAVAL